jgi:hypothetical protein
MLTKNQVGLTGLGLNNGAMGVVISIIYAENTAPPYFPLAVVVDFPGYKGPAWIQQHPKWVPIPVNKLVRCEYNCCSRTGIPLMPGYAIPIAKSQGMTIGKNKPATHSRVKLQQAKFMEALSLGTTYTALSRVERESNWCLVEKIPEDRLLYINDHPQMAARREEEQRLMKLSNKTVKDYIEYGDVKNYVELLSEFDNECNDTLRDSICVNKDVNCNCILCKQLYK